jgi:Fic family protein
MQQLNKLSLKQSEQLFRELRISITHHSNAIEGTTLSYGETKELLELGHTAGHKPLGEQLVILGFAKAYDVIVREATNPNNIIDNSFIKDIHAIMFEDALKVAPEFVSKPIGAYRLDERYIKGVDIKLSLPHQISNDIENLLYRFKNNDMDLKGIAQFHILFERIHPFADGNGRVGRLLMAYQAIQNNIVPPLIYRSSNLYAPIGLDTNSGATFRASSNIMACISLIKPLSMILFGFVASRTMTS